MVGPALYHTENSKQNHVDSQNYEMSILDICLLVQAKLRIDCNKHPVFPRQNYEMSTLDTVIVGPALYHTENSKQNHVDSQNYEMSILDMSKRLLVPPHSENSKYSASHDCLWLKEREPLQPQMASSVSYRQEAPKSVENRECAVGVPQDS